MAPHERSGAHEHGVAPVAVEATVDRPVHYSDIIVLMGDRWPLRGKVEELLTRSKSASRLRIRPSRLRAAPLRRQGLVEHIRRGHRYRVAELGIRVAIFPSRV
jgi:hypothetical protein